jgi:hypothetical protein
MSGLSTSERLLVAAAESGKPVDLRGRNARLNDPGRAAAWGTERTIRAEILAELLRSGAASSGQGRLRSIRLYGARIVGQLDLEAVTIACPLFFDGCLFEDLIILRDAEALAIRLPGCHVPGIAAKQLTTRGDLLLNDKFAASGEVCLAGATIGGQLILDGASLSNSGGKALSASWLTVGQSLLCRAGFMAHGQVELEGARIGGTLSMDGATIVNTGTVALEARRMTVQGAMYCREGFRVQGELRIFGAHIGGQLNFDGAVLEHEDGRTLYASQLKVEHSMFCRHGFISRGEIILDGASIGGRFSLSGAQLLNPGRRTISADRLTVGQSMYCRNQFTSRGEIALIDAQIGGRIDFNDAIMANATGCVLDAGGLDVARDMTFSGEFAAEGEIHLLDAQIGGRLDFDGARLTTRTDRLLNLEGIRASVLFLRPRESPDGLVDLANARVGAFFDDPRTWASRLRLRGFAYDALGNTSVPVRDRLAWLDRNEGGYLPEIYEQLAGAYRRAGRLEDARQVAIAKQRQRSDQLNRLARVWNWLLYVTVGYGYRTWLAGIWLAGLVAAGTAVFAAAYPAHMRQSATVVPAFNPFVYTLDTVLPIIDLGEQKAWIAQGAALTVQWLLTCAGWLLTTAVVAGLTSALNRRD